MSTISLGKISTNKQSLFKVSATSSTGNALEYRLVSGKLPPGLNIAPSGEITGRTKEIIFNLDDGVTNLDSGNTTIDRKFDFTVEAKNKNGTVTNRQVFSITESKISDGEVANIFAKVRPTKTTRKELDAFITSPDLFPDESLYRKGELNFRTDDLSFLILAGINKPDLTVINNLLNENFYNTTLRIGDLKTAKAKDPNGNTIYELIYAELIDPYVDSPNEIVFSAQNLPNISFTYYASSTKILASSPIRANGKVVQVFVNSIKNMQDDLEAGLTVQNFDYLPQWMKSPQNDNLVPGFKLALPIKYVKPGESEKILYRINNESQFDFKNVPVLIDRFYVTKHNGTTIDNVRTPQNATGDGVTKVFSLDQGVTKSNNVLVTLDGVGVDASLYSITAIPTTAQNQQHSADKTTLTADSNKLTADLNKSKNTHELTFDTAPANGTAIVFKRKKTTFGLKEFVTLDTNTTSFDEKGTRFNVQPLTFDNKQPEDTQLLLLRSDVMDNVIHVSKQRELIRTPI